MYYKKLWDDYTFNNNSIKKWFLKGMLKKGRSKDFIKYKKIKLFFSIEIANYKNGENNEKCAKRNKKNSFSIKKFLTLFIQSL